MPKIPQNVRFFFCPCARIPCLIIRRLNLITYVGQVAIDRAAATRFIKHAIAQAKDTPSTNDSVPVPGPSTHTRIGDNDEAGTASAIRVPVTVTEKMLEREQYHAALQREDALVDEEESGDLEVIDGEEPDGPLSDDTSPHQTSRGSGLEANNNKTESKGKGKAKAVEPIPTFSTAQKNVLPSSETTITGKRRRPAIDPFAGLCLLCQLTIIFI
jgi:exosome complex protein LRP1